MGLSGWALDPSAGAGSLDLSSFQKKRAQSNPMVHSQAPCLQVRGQAVQLTPAKKSRLRKPASEEKVFGITAVEQHYPKGLSAMMGKSCPVW